MSGPNPSRRTRRALLSIGTLALASLTPWTAAPASAQTTITVTTTADGSNWGDSECSLDEAIQAANLDQVIDVCPAGNGADVIVLPAGGVFARSHVADDTENEMGPTATPVVGSAIRVEGNGARIERPTSAPLMRAFAVHAGDGTGDLTVRDVHIKGFSVHGGDGRDGGGGGLGAGGAIYVREAGLTVEDSTLEGNRAEGGNGGGTSSSGGGGGGGLAGTGGIASGQVYDAWYSSGGGGGGGARGDGGSSVSSGPFGQVRAASTGGGGGGTLTDGEGNTDDTPFGRDGGVACGGTGGEAKGDGTDGCDGGGGGGGGQARLDPIASDGGTPGAGGYGGGGGGGGFGAEEDCFFGCEFNFSSHDGGHGGFGGGGGAAGGGASGGPGGFGGGGGGASAGNGFTSGGSFAGHGGIDDGSSSFPGAGAGGGGAALGGAIFGDGATVTLRNTTLTGNSVARGSGGPAGGGVPAANGSDAGAAIFAVDGAVSVSNSTITGNESTGDAAGVAMYRSSRSGYAASLALTNTIVAANIPASNECHLFGSVSSTGTNNLYGANLNCPSAASTSGDPLLAPLAVEAPGSTPTMAIDDSSPAFDAGDDDTCEQFDQRGVSRPRSLHCDIGAYEFVEPSADLAVATTPVGATVAGEDLQYVVQVHNNGPTAAEDVTVVDTLPAGTTFVSITGSGGLSCAGTGPVTCTTPLMHEGATALLTLTVHVPETTADGTAMTNAVTVSTTTPDPVPANDTASATSTVTTRSDVSVTKTGPARPVAGADATYRITVANAGPSTARNVVLDDTITAGTTYRSLASPAGWACTTPAVGSVGQVSCTVATMAPGTDAGFTLVVRLPASTADGTEVCNTATTTASTTDPAPGNNSSRTCGDAQTLADLGVTGTASTTGKAGKGTATFTVTVTNDGPSDSQNVAVTATSDLFSGPPPTIAATSGATCTVSGSTASCSWASLAVGASTQVTITVPWRSAVGSVCLTAAVTSGTPDPDATDNTSSVCAGKKNQKNPKK